MVKVLEHLSHERMKEMKLFRLERAQADIINAFKYPRGRNEDVARLSPVLSGKKKRGTN